MSKRVVFERSRRELSLGVSVGVHIFLVVEQSSLESQSRGCVPRLRYLRYTYMDSVRTGTLNCSSSKIQYLVRIRYGDRLTTEEITKSCTHDPSSTEKLGPPLMELGRH